MDGLSIDPITLPLKQRLVSLQLGWKEKQLLTSIADRDGMLQGDLLAQIVRWFDGLTEVEKLLLVGSDRDGEALARKYIARLAEGDTGTQPVQRAVKQAVG